MAAFRARYPDLPAQRSSRIHCIAWRGWTTVPQAEAAAGIRIDFNYYNWPPEWIAGRQVYMAGTGFPMPYAELNGDVVDVYQAPTQLVNQDGVPHPDGIEQLLDAALGPDQFFGAFGTHYDYTEDYLGALTETAQTPRRGADHRGADAGLASGPRRIALHRPVMAGPHAHLPHGHRPRRRTRLRPAAGDVAGPGAAGPALRRRILPLAAEEIKGLRMAFFPAATGVCAARYRSAGNR